MGNADNIIIGAAQVRFDNDDVGYTKGGTMLRYEPEFIDVVADQVGGVVRKARSLERAYVRTTLLEVTLEQIRRAFMFPKTNLDSSTLTLGYNNSCWSEETEIILVTVSPSCGTRTFTFPRCVAFGSREYNMTREEETAFEVEFEVLKDSNGHFGTCVDS